MTHGWCGVVACCRLCVVHGTERSAKTSGFGRSVRFMNLAFGFEFEFEFGLGVLHLRGGAPLGSLCFFGSRRLVFAGMLLGLV